ncbi:hypothetical protein [Aquimarina pacifica]|uniref:hypothetical protein n=1 Tax=Aquimarina pacifica TaxID=1296415 RepID=UPI000472417A|nr:hypothetical protein [Aquimarina pacifica]
MDGLITILTKEINWIETLFLTVFSLGIALFYTLAVRSLYKIKYKPIWLFFVLFPCIIIITKLITPNIVLAVFFTLFASLFILFIFGFVYRFINDVIITSRKTVNTEKKGSVLFSTITTIGVSILGLIGMFFLGPYALIFVFLFVIFKNILFPGSKDNFLKLQSILPTSKIRSMAMGLVEITGKVKMIDPIESRLEKKECIGYTYRVESISRDKDGKKSYSTIKYETICNPFLVDDTTAEAFINNKDLELLNLETDIQYSNSNKRYTQCILKNNDEVLIIGKATIGKQRHTLEKEPIKNVFGLMPVKSVSRWNILLPLRENAYQYGIVLLLAIACILIADITIENDTVLLRFNTFSFNFTELFNF